MNDSFVMDNIKAFTLAELLIYITLAGIVSTGLFETFLTTINLYNRNDQTVGTFQEIRSALLLMASEIRMAGCDPTGTGNFGFINEQDLSGKDRFDTDEDSLNFTLDNNYPYDGLANDPNEKINYYLYPSNGNFKKLGRKTGYLGNPQPIAENITFLKFTYFNKNNQDITQNLDLKNINLIKIEIKAESQKIDPLLKRRRKFILTTYVRIRNVSN